MKLVKIMLVDMEEIFDKLNENEAVLHFNINNLEWAKYILEVAREENTSVILGVSESAIKYMGGYKTVYNLVSGLVLDLNIKIPVVLHLDHGHSIESCKKAIDAGFTSVMIDASSLPLSENIEIRIAQKESIKKYKIDSTEKVIDLHYNFVTSELSLEDTEDTTVNMDENVIIFNHTNDTKSNKK